MVEGGVRTGQARATSSHVLVWRRIEDSRPFVRRHESLDGQEKFGPAFAGTLEKSGTLVGRSGQRLLEYRFFVHGRITCVVMCSVIAAYSLALPHSMRRK